MTENTIDWRSDIYDVLREQNIEQVCYVPDAGHAALIRNCEADNSMTVVGLTTEEDGVGVMTGAWRSKGRIADAEQRRRQYD